MSWSWPIPGGDVSLSSHQEFRAKVGYIIYEGSVSPFLLLRPLLGKYYLVAAAAVCGALIYGLAQLARRHFSKRLNESSRSVN